MAATTRITFPENMKMIKQTLTVANWKGSGPYEYTVTVAGLTATQMVFVHNDMGLSKEQIEEFGKACITAKSQSAGSFILQALNKPTKDLPIVIELGGETMS